MALDPRRILYKDDYLLAVFKLPRELVVQGKGKMEKLPLLDFLKKDEPGLHPLQRLDFETSGIVLFARSNAVVRRVLETKYNGWHKTYKALVLGHVSKPKGEITFKLPSRESKEEIPATTKYRVLEKLPGVTLVEVEIESGRHHQIRRHFAKIGHPLVCDDEYGESKANRAFGRAFGYHHFFLHASHLRFVHPMTGETIEIDSPLPPAFEGCLKKLRKHH